MNCVLQRMDSLEYFSVAFSPIVWLVAGAAKNRQASFWVGRHFLWLFPPSAVHGSILILIAAVVSSLVVSFGSFGNFTMTVISLEELSKHTAPNDTWMAIHGLVYDTSGFMTEHPGGQVLVCRCSNGCRWPHSGAQLLESVAGQDASAEFEACPRFACPPAQSVSACGCGWQDALHSTAARTEEKISCKGVLAGSEKQAVGSVLADTCAFSSPRPCTTKP